MCCILQEFMSLVGIKFCKFIESLKNIIQHAASKVFMRKSWMCIFQMNMTVYIFPKLVTKMKFIWNYLRKFKNLKTCLALSLFSNDKDFHKVYQISTKWRFPEQTVYQEGKRRENGKKCDPGWLNHQLL
jgi:hypothetical protein